MCGIIGYIGKQNAVPILVDGLKRLEYRGYDSSGLAVVDHGHLTILRAVGKLANLERLVSSQHLESTLGIGHVRWATHGKPSEENAHPHRAGRVALVHNGIIENYLELKRELEALGRTFASETDTEVIGHLVDHYLGQGHGLVEAVRLALGRVQGAYALGIVAEDEPEVLVAARNGSPLVVGLGEGEFFIASDIPAILNYTRDVVFLDDREMAVLTPGGVEVTDLEGRPAHEKPISHIQWNPVMAEKGGYRHFMLKEIHEQPRAITDTLRGRLSLETGTVFLEEFHLTPETAKGMTRIHLVACGTSWHAALVGKFLLEDLARIPAEVDIASEFRYRNPILDPQSLLVAITQSGETADTLAALREAQRRGARTLAICNVVGSTASREADGVLYTHAGPEIGVASTKAFTTQLAALFLLALHLGRLRETLSEDRAKALLSDLVRVPQWVERALEAEEAVAEVARLYYERQDFLYLARGINYPIALEGALKLKEISYIHAEGYPAGEMKHGPIALIDEHLPVVVLAPRDALYEKVLANIEEVKARGGTVIAVTTEGNADLAGKVDHCLAVPGTVPLLQPILLSVPVQLLAYHIADLRGSDIDQPRNLAKSVTVE